MLYKVVAAGAVHNSGERFPPPQCHPNTRLAVQAEILEWVNDRESQRRAMWMLGAAGAGKSAIAQMIAQILHESGQLSSSFFFNRTSTTGRNDDEQLVATLAYQMSKHIPETRPFISANILADPLIFDMLLELQLEALIIDPLSRLWDGMTHEELPRLIIIDGLDECSNKDEAQARIVNVCRSTLAPAAQTPAQGTHRQSARIHHTISIQHARRWFSDQTITFGFYMETG